MGFNDAIRNEPPEGEDPEDTIERLKGEVNEANIKIERMRPFIAHKTTCNWKQFSRQCNCGFYDI